MGVERAGELAQLSDAVGRATKHEDVVGHEEVVAVGVAIGDLVARERFEAAVADAVGQLDVTE